MTAPRFFCTRDECPQLLSGAGQSLTLPRHIAHHAVRVLRLNVGDALVLFDGAGYEVPAVIERIETPQSVQVRLGQTEARSSESPLAVTLLQTLQAADKMDFTIQKAVELGVARIQPLAGRRSVIKLSGERKTKRVAHWQSIAIAACAQCGRNVVPEVADVVPMEEWLCTEGRCAAEQKLILAPAATQRLSDLPATQKILLLVGAEGGFAPEEEAAAAAAGFQPVGLGPRILRTETAGLAALAALQTLWGDFC